MEESMQCSKRWLIHHSEKNKGILFCIRSYQPKRHQEILFIITEMLQYVFLTQYSQQKP